MMFKLLLIISLLQFQATTPEAEATGESLHCPVVTEFQKTGQTANSITCSWAYAIPNTQYKVWWVRQEDGAFSGYAYTYSQSHTFTSLSAGTYTFYVQALCGQEGSQYVGIEDWVPA